MQQLIRLGRRMPCACLLLTLSAGFALAEPWSAVWQDNSLEIRGDDRSAPWRSTLVATLQMLESGEAQLGPDHVLLRGVAAAPVDDAIARLAAELPAHLTLTTDIVQLPDAAGVARLCQRMFAALPRTPIRFFESSTDFRPASLPMLQRIAEFAHDCGDMRLRIVGHSDASGDEAWNRQLSRLRAAAVAAWLEAHGVARERLTIDGVGSSQPIADNATRIGRQKNRRIEFELLP